MLQKQRVRDSGKSPRGVVPESEWPWQWAEYWVEVTSKQDVAVCPLEYSWRLSLAGGW